MIIINFKGGYLNIEYYLRLYCGSSATPPRNIINHQCGWMRVVVVIQSVSLSVKLWLNSWTYTEEQWFKIISIKHCKQFWLSVASSRQPTSNTQHQRNGVFEFSLVIGCFNTIVTSCSNFLTKKVFLLWNNHTIWNLGTTSLML